MLHQVLKSVFARRQRTYALILEIIIVTVIGWMVVEPVAVRTSQALIPAGYDHDRLLMLSLEKLGPGMAGYDSTLGDESRQDAIVNIYNKIKQRPGVESATYIMWQGIEQSGHAQMGRPVAEKYQREGEENNIFLSTIQYVPGTDYFRTFGITASNGTPFTEPDYVENGFVISSIVGEAIFPDSSAIGKDLIEETWDKHSTPIIGVVSDVTYSKGQGSSPIVYKCITLEEAVKGYISGIVLRLGADVNPYAFLSELYGDLPEYRSGLYFLTEPRLFNDLRENNFAPSHRELMRGWIIAVFFLLNVLLGVAGTFYIQSRSRIPDAGVMRAFGATRRRIETSIMLEACVIAFIGWLIGSVIYLVYLHFTGYASDVVSDDYIVRLLRPMWYHALASRYAVVGAIVLGLLMLVALLGSWMPAKRVGKVTPVAALHDE